MNPNCYILPGTRSSVSDTHRVRPLLLSIVAMGYRRSGWRHHHTVRESVLVGHMWALVVIGSVCMLRHWGWWHRSTVTGVRGIPTLWLRRRHILLVRWHSGHGRWWIHRSAIWWNRRRVPHGLHVGTTHIPAWRSGVRSGHHVLRWRWSTAIWRVTIEHHRITHACSLGGLSIRIFLVWWRCGLVRCHLGRMGNDREHLHVLLASERPDRGNGASIGDLVILERIEIVLDMHRHPLDRSDAKVRVG